MRSSFRSNRLRGACLAIAFVLAAPAEAVPRKLPPIDQCKDGGLPPFLAKMTGAVRTRDGKALLDLVSADVQIGFAGDDGKAAFTKLWHPEQGNSELWPVIERMLALGCAGSGQTRLIPSLGEQLDDDDDPFELLLVTDPAARLRATSAPGSSTIAYLGWDVVQQVERDGVQAKVRLQDGRVGWLWDRQVYAPLDYRMVLEKTGGRWMIVALVAGD